MTDDEIEKFISTLTGREKELLAVVGSKAIAGAEERIAAWIEKHFGGNLDGVAKAIRNGEHVGAGEPSTARPLDALQVAAVRKYQQTFYPCTCHNGDSPECQACFGDVELFAAGICDGTFLEPVAANGEAK